MLELKPLSNFFIAIQDDPCINTTHISLYMALLQFWTSHDNTNPISIFGREIMQICKISGPATYHKCIKELNDYGYIKYIPSYYRNKRSLVYFLKI
jgi:replication initiation and membrane attachment protein DnaB